MRILQRSRGRAATTLYSNRPRDAEASLSTESRDRKRIGNKHCHSLRRLHAFRRRIALNNPGGSREYHPGSQVTPGNTGFPQRLSDSGQPAHPPKAVNSVTPCYLDWCMLASRYFAHCASAARIPTDEYVTATGFPQIPYRRLPQQILPSVCFIVNNTCNRNCPPPIQTSGTSHPL